MVDWKEGRGAHVENEQGVLGCHDLRGRIAGDLVNLFVPPMIPALDPGNGVAGPLQNEDVFYQGTLFQGTVDYGLGRDGLSTSLSLVAGDDDSGRAVVDAVA